MTPSPVCRIWAASVLTCLLSTSAVLAEAATPAPAQFDCVADPAQSLDIGASTTGLLTEVLVSRGDHVTRGQVVARLDSRVQAAVVAISRAQAEATQSRDVAATKLKLAQTQMERSRKLVQTGAGNAAQFEQDSAALEIAQQQLAAENDTLRVAGLELERQQAMLDQLSVTSPIDGIVTEIHLRAGEFVRQDSPIMKLAQIEPLHVESWLPVDLWGKLTPDTAASVHLSQPSEQDFPAKISVIDKVFDAASGTFGVRLDLANPGGKLPAGQRCKLSLNIGAQ